MEAMMARILVVDDERSMREFLEILLSKKGHDVETASDGNAARTLVGQTEYDLVVTDLKMPGPSGMDVLAAVKQTWPETEVIVMTAYSTTETAVEAMRRGAYHYVCKPFEVNEVSVIIEKAMEKRDLVLSNRRLKDEVGSRSFESLVGGSAKMGDLFRTIRRIADTKSSVLVTGESGTGKELVARAIHFNSSRRDKPLTVINCGAIPDALMESELFGHVKGSFTGAVADKKGLFEVANGGTIFLDEIGELTPHLQVKLLRAIQERKVKPVGGVREVDIDVRLVAATNKDLEAEVKAGRFRDDLYFRINVIQLQIPPLRERREDIPVLAHHFLERHGHELPRTIRGFTREAMRLLSGYDFPGNVRELENIVERALAFEHGEWISPESLPSRLTGVTAAQPDPDVRPGPESFNLDQYVEDIERKWVLEAMQACMGSVTESARKLGISFRSMRYKLAKYGIRKEDFSGQTQ
jgi:two-component system response regulator PilR (NtrC family)